MPTVVDRTAGSVLADEEVIARVLGGETPLFEIIMRRYNQRLFRTVRGILKDDGEAEDVVQQSYVNAYLHLYQFEGRAKFSTWLTRIAVHEAWARARRDARMDQLEFDTWSGGSIVDTLKSAEPDPERQAVNGELKRVLESAIDQLSPAYRSVFMMREVEGLSTAETAECLALTDEAVKVRLHRARGMLREALAASVGPMAHEAFGFDGERCDRIVTGVFDRLSRL